MIPLRSPRWPEREYTRSVEDKTRRGRAHLAPPHGNHGDVRHDFDYDYDLAPPCGNHGDHDYYVDDDNDGENNDQC